MDNNIDETIYEKELISYKEQLMTNNRQTPKTPPPTPIASLLSSSSSSSALILMPAVPLFQLNNNHLFVNGTNSSSSSFANNNEFISSSSSSSSSSSASSTSTSTTKFLNVDTNPNASSQSSSSSSSSQFNSINSFENGNNYNNNINNLDWSNSLFRPANRFSISTRRECKSTSDEAYVFELNGNESLINNSNNHTTKLINSTIQSSSHSISPIRHNSNTSTTTINKFVDGQFGFNPKSLFYNKSILTNNKSKLASSSNFVGEKLALKFSSVNKEKKSVKRLTFHSKFGIENLNKKHSDYIQNKKLFHSVSNNDFNSVAELLDTNMYDVNCGDDKQRTCLHIASSRGNVDIVRLLLEYGANPNIRDCVGNLAIHLAIISSHVPVVIILLEAGTDIHSLDLQGKTVLHLAGTRLRWLLNDENHKASPKLKYEAIMIMNMIKEYLRRKKSASTDLDVLANQLENAFNLDDINHLTKELLDRFETMNIKPTTTTNIFDSFNKK